MPHFLPSALSRLSRLPRLPRFLRPAALALAAAALLGGTLALAPAGCRQKTAGIRNADKPDAVKSSLDGVWTLTLNPEVVEQGGQSMNLSLSLAAKRVNGTAGTLDGTLAGVDISDGKYRLGGDLNTPAIEFTSGDVTIPTDPGDPSGGRVVSGPLQWKADLVDDDTLAGTVTGGAAGGKSNRWTAKKNRVGV